MKQDERIYVSKVLNGHVTLGWVVSPCNGLTWLGTFGPFQTREAALCWAQEWTTADEVWIFPISCPANAALKVLQKYANVGWSMPVAEDDDGACSEA